MTNILQDYHTVLGNMVGNSNAPVGLYRAWADLTLILCSVIQVGNTKLNLRARVKEARHLEREK